MVQWLEHRAHDLKVVGSNLCQPIAIMEDSTLGQGVNTNVPLSTQEYKWAPGLRRDGKCEC